MSKPEYNGEIPWDKMDKWAVNWTAFTKAVIIILISSAMGVLALYQSYSASKLASDNSSLIQNLTKSNTRLIEENKDLRYEHESNIKKLELLQTELISLRDQMALKDSQIEKLEKREKELLARIEELEKKIETS